MNIRYKKKRGVPVQGLPFIEWSKGLNMSRHTVKNNVEAMTESTQEQLDTLRTQVQQLLENYVNPRLLDAAERTDHAVANARKIKDHEIENVSTRVRAQPIAAVLISAVVGFLAGRFSK